MRRTEERRRESLYFDNSELQGNSPIFLHSLLPIPRINSLETTSIFLQQLHLDESTERKEIQRQRDLKAKKKSLRRRTTKKMSGRQKWNPPKNTISLAQLFRVKKLIDPENTQCESFPTSEESNGNLIRMLYRQYQSDQEKCQESVKRELNETILRDMPKQILDEYKMSCEDYDTKKITEATNEESNDKVEKVENKKEEEEEIELIENDNTKWHARTFPYPRPANFELGIQEFLKTGKRTISKIPGGYLSGSEKSHRMFFCVVLLSPMEFNPHTYLTNHNMNK